MPRRAFRHAHTLLQASDGAYDHQIASALHADRSTVQCTRERFCSGGLKAALYELPRPGAEPKLDGKGEALLVALACSTAPEGREHWSMQMLADKIVELGIVEEISDETIRRTLKNDVKPWLCEQWYIPKVDADYIWRMEGVLDLYAELLIHSAHCSPSMSVPSNCSRMCVSPSPAVRASLEGRTTSTRERAPATSSASLRRTRGS